MATRKPSPARTIEHRSIRAAFYLSRIEDAVLVLIALVLSILALLLLGTTVVTLVNSVVTGAIRDLAIEILDNVLLVMITMEIVYTVTLSLESHTLTAEPFLIVGAIAAIRRVLVITAATPKLEANPEVFRSTLMELGLLAAIIISIAAAVYILRKGQSYPSEKNK